MSEEKRVVSPPLFHLHGLTSSSQLQFLFIS